MFECHHACTDLDLADLCLVDLNVLDLDLADLKLLTWAVRAVGQVACVDLTEWLY